MQTGTYNGTVVTTTKGAEVQQAISLATKTARGGNFHLRLRLSVPCSGLSSALTDWSFLLALTGRHRPVHAELSSRLSCGFSARSTSFRNLCSSSNMR